MFAVYIVEYRKRCAMLCVRSVVGAESFNQQADRSVFYFFALLCVCVGVFFLGCCSVIVQIDAPFLSHAHARALTFFPFNFCLISLLPHTVRQNRKCENLIRKYG